MSERRPYHKTPGPLEYIFHIEKRHSTIATELLGGVVHFLGNVFNLVATASILTAGGLPATDGIIGGAWAGCIGQLLMGLLSNLPICCSAGAGPNATVAFLLAQSAQSGGLGSYRDALACCLCSGLVITILTVGGVIDAITDLVPASLKSGICGGIGLLCAFVGFQQVGIVVRSSEGLIGPGAFANNPEIWLSLTGLMMLTIMIQRKVQGAFLITMALTTAVYWGCVSGWPDLRLQTPQAPTLYTPAFESIKKPYFWMQVSAMTLMLVFDAMGCVFGLAKMAGRFDETSNAVEGGNGIFYSIGLGTSLAALCGVSPLVISGTSSAAINDGAKTGLSTCVSGLLMLIVGVPFSPVLAKLPPCATSFVLIYSGVSMFSDTSHINWSDPIAAVPAFLCVISQPFLFSIADGIYMGLASAFVLHLLSGRLFQKEASGVARPARLSPSPQVTPLIGRSSSTASVIEAMASPKYPRATSIVQPHNGNSRCMTYVGSPPPSCKSVAKAREPSDLGRSLLSEFDAESSEANLLMCA
jgi:AGZA family xanthine/uracil permease-like MFS transporter